MGWEWVAREQRLKGEAGWACDLGRECPDQQSGQGPRAGEPAAPAEHGGGHGTPAPPGRPGDAGFTRRAMESRGWSGAEESRDLTGGPGALAALIADTV